MSCLTSCPISINEHAQASANSDVGHTSNCATSKPSMYAGRLHYPASIAPLAQRWHWSASSRSAADVAPTLVFRRLRCYGMSAFCRSATVGISWFADVLCLDIGGWKSSVSRKNYIFRHHDQKNYYASNVNKMYHFAASILFYDIAQLRFPPKAIWVQQVVSTVFPGVWLRKIRQCFFVFRQLSRRFF